MFIPSPTGRDNMAFNLFAMEQEGYFDDEIDDDEDEEYEDEDDD